MALRTIMIFPEFDNVEVIENIRRQYDPLYSLVRPHITLVFPFDDEISNQDLQKKIEEVLRNYHPFPLALQGISKESSTFGNYIFLNVADGSESLCSLNSALYRALWGTNGLDYVPHMTVGKLEKTEEMDRAYTTLAGLESRFETVVHSISVEMIGEHEESMIIMEVSLR